MQFHNHFMYVKCVFNYNALYGYAEQCLIEKVIFCIMYIHCCKSQSFIYMRKERPYAHKTGFIMRNNKKGVYSSKKQQNQSIEQRVSVDVWEFFHLVFGLKFHI